MRTGLPLRQRAAALSRFCLVHAARRPAANRQFRGLPESCAALLLWCEHCGRRGQAATEDGGRATEDGGLRAEDGDRKSEVGGQRTEVARESREYTELRRTETGELRTGSQVCPRNTRKTQKKVQRTEQSGWSRITRMGNRGRNSEGGVQRPATAVSVASV
jgi:hypothetical protein